MTTSQTLLMSTEKRIIFSAISLEECAPVYDDFLTYISVLPPVTPEELFSQGSNLPRTSVKQFLGRRILFRKGNSNVINSSSQDNWNSYDNVYLSFPYIPVDELELWQIWKSA